MERLKADRDNQRDAKDRIEHEMNRRATADANHAAQQLALQDAKHAAAQNAALAQQAMGHHQAATQQAQGMVSDPLVYGIRTHLLTRLLRASPRCWRRNNVTIA